MASTKYIGYVGGVAVAMGVGAAIAAAGQGTAGADTTDGGSSAKESTSSSGGSGVNAGPKRADSDTKSDAKPDRTKPVSKLNDGVEKVTAQITKTAASVSKSISDSLTKPTTKPSADKPEKPKAKPSAEEFEAKQVERLKDLFTPKQAAAPKPDDSTLEDAPTVKPAGKTITTTPTVTTAVEAAADTAADAAEEPQPWNPFRPNDQEPEPTDIPDEIIQLRNALMAVTPEALDAFDPFIREATEQIYRGSQIVPWVNAVIPISKIVEELAPALGDTDEARDARQIIINELIKTTPPGSLLYYGWDIAADLLNQEVAGDALKQEFFITAWNVLDPFELAHNTGKSGIGQAAG